MLSLFLVSSRIPHPQRKPFIEAILLAMAIFVSGVAFADDAPCSEHENFQERERALGSAALWGNLRGNPGSINFESQRLLEDAVQSLAKIKDSLSCEEEHGNSKNCQRGDAPQIEFQVVPNKFLESYSDKKECERLQQETQLHPIRFQNLKFASVKKFNDWFSDFSQGKGKEGGELYAQCDGKCSPQYTSRIHTNDSGGMTVDVSVLCGPARDTGDNSYVLVVGYRWKCVPPGQQAKAE